MMCSIVMAQITAWKMAQSVGPMYFIKYSFIIIFISIFCAMIPLAWEESDKKLK